GRPALREVRSALRHRDRRGDARRDVRWAGGGAVPRGRPYRGPPAPERSRPPGAGRLSAGGPARPPGDPAGRADDGAAQPPLPTASPAHVAAGPVMTLQLLPRHEDDPRPLSVD